MLKPLEVNFKGIVTISGPTKSGKSKFAEFLIKDQHSITYIATARPRPNDSEWQKRIELHRLRRPTSWKLVEYPNDICNIIDSTKERESLLIDSLGGLVEQNLDKSDNDWESFQNNVMACITHSKLGIAIVVEETGWGVSPSTEIGHMFRERLCNCSIDFSIRESIC